MSAAQRLGLFRGQSGTGWWEIRRASPDVTPSLDPNLETTAPGAWVYFDVLAGLLTLDDKMQLKPALATSYEVMSPTRVRFKLRSGVKFHDGTPFNAEAVKFTFDRALKARGARRRRRIAALR